MGTPLVESNGLVLTKPGEIANHFNEFYVGKVSKLRQDMTITDNSKANDCIKKIIMKDKLCEFKFLQIEVSEVERLLRSLPDSKTAGLDNLDGKVLRLTAGIIASPICHIINRSLEVGLCPKRWKEAKVIPLPKDTKAVFNERNSRPISILSVLSKIMERLVYLQIQAYFTSNNLLTNFQHAYRAGHSTSTALIQMTDDWLKAIDNSMLVGAVLLDFSAAFDVLDHLLLVEKLKCYGFNSSALKWIMSYLSSRSQKVYLNGSLSSNRGLESGVPQGSCLGPLLFSVFTNDLPWATKSATTVLFADDSTLYCSAKSCDELNEVLSRELNVVHDWAACNRLVLNISKTKCIVLGTRHRLSTSPKLDLNLCSLAVQQVESTKLLGVMLDCTLSWSKHIDYILLKMGRAIGVSRKCASFVARPLLRRIVQSLVLCHLDYCSMVWSSANSGDLRKLQVVQNRAARLVLGCSPRSNVSRMHACLSWLTVENRLKCNTLVLFKSVMTAKMPVFIHEQIVFSNTMHNHYTRGSSNGQLELATSKNKNNALMRSFIFRSLSLWNNLPLTLCILSKLSFKRTLKVYLTL